MCAREKRVYVDVRVCELNDASVGSIDRAARAYERTQRTWNSGKSTAFSEAPLKYAQIDATLSG